LSRALIELSSALAGFNVPVDVNPPVMPTSARPSIVEAIAPYRAFPLIPHVTIPVIDPAAEARFDQFSPAARLPGAPGSPPPFGANLETARRIAPIGYATSIMDYLFRWLDLKFLKADQGQLFESLPAPLQPAPPSNGKGMVESLGELVQLGDGPVCNICGSLMVRSGSCHRCMTCGSTSGCS